MDLQSVASLHVHNPGSSVSEFYELNCPYMIMYQSCNPDQKTCTFLTAVPGNLGRITLNDAQMDSMKKRSLHQHDFFEVMFVLSGEIRHRIEKKVYRYQTGQCCVLNRNIRHLEELSTEYEVVFLMLTEEFLAQLLEHDVQYSDSGVCNSYFGAVYHLIEQNRKKRYYPVKEYMDFSPCHSFLSEEQLLNEFFPLFNQLIEETVAQKPGCMFIVEGLISRFFSLLETPSLYQKTQVRLSSTREELLLNKIGHIFEACHGRISREELAFLMNYNSDYLNRIVKRQTGMSLMTYGQMFCLREAERLLLESSKSISEIVSALGFSNRSYFYRVFEARYGMTPKEYRRMHQIYL